MTHQFTERVGTLDGRGVDAAVLHAGLQTLPDLRQHVDEDGGQKDAAAEAHQAGHEVLDPLHALLLDELDQEERTESGPELDEAEEDEDDHFRSDQIHFCVFCSFVEK